MARKRSGGPRTPEGKARSSMNAVKHGMRAQSPVIPDVESEKAWQSHRQAIVDAYEVEGAVEEALAGRVAVLVWRLDRVVAYERQMTTERRKQIIEDLLSWAVIKSIQTKKQPDDYELQEQGERMAAMRILPDAREIDKIRRYESTLHRMLLQTMRQLDDMQARRRAQQRSGQRDIEGEVTHRNPSSSA